MWGGAFAAVTATACIAGRMVHRELKSRNFSPYPDRELTESSSGLTKRLKRAYNWVFPKTTTENQYNALKGTVLYVEDTEVRDPRLNKIVAIANIKSIEGCIVDAIESNKPELVTIGKQIRLFDDKRSVHSSMVVAKKFDMIKAWHKCGLFGTTYDFVGHLCLFNSSKRDESNKIKDCFELAFSSHEGSGLDKKAFLDVLMEAINNQDRNMCESLVALADQQGTGDFISSAQFYALWKKVIESKNSDLVRVFSCNSKMKKGLHRLDREKRKELFKQLIRTGVESIFYALYSDDPYEDDDKLIKGFSNNDKKELNMLAQQYYRRYYTEDLFILH